MTPGGRPARGARGLRGNAILEFAIGAGVLLTAFGGTFRFGYTFIQYNRLQIAVSQGARYASLVPYDSPNATPSDAFQSAVRNMVLYGSPTAVGSPVLNGLSPENITLTVTFANGIPTAVSVAVNAFTIDSLFGKATLNNKPKVTYPYQGIWTPI